MNKKIISVCLAILLLCSLLPLAVFAEEPATLVSHGVAFISERGNLILNLTIPEVLEKFDYGDVVTVSMGSLSVDMPIVNGYCVDAGDPAIYLHSRDQEVRLISNMKQFVNVYGIAHQLHPEDKNSEWIYEDGFSADMDVTITMKEKAGFLEEFRIRSAEYTNNRADYPNLTDAEFANFRMVTVGDIAPGVLYRSATPINPERGRNTYSDAAAREAGVTVFVNLADTEEEEQALAGFAGSYYSQQKRVCVGATMDFDLPDNRQRLANGLRFMAENPGVYDIFCLEGKDRTGFFLTVLEGLMGANAEEMERDYVLSFDNYYGFGWDSDAAPYLVKGNFIKNAESNIGVSPESENFQQAVEAYVIGLGLTEAEVAQLKANLSGGEATPETEAAETEAQLPEPTEQEAQKSERFSASGILIAVIVLAGLCWIALRKKKK